MKISLPDLILGVGVGILVALILGLFNSGSTGWTIYRWVMGVVFIFVYIQFQVNMKWKSLLLFAEEEINKKLKIFK